MKGRNMRIGHRIGNFGSRGGNCISAVASKSEIRHHMKAVTTHGEQSERTVYPPAEEEGRSLF